MKKTKISLINVLLISVILIVIVSGCCSPYGYVAKEWSRMMREQQVSPIFPPREDIRIGDIFLSEEDPDYDPTLAHVKNYLPVPLLLATVSVNSEIKDQYLLRGEFPISPTNMFSVSTNGTITELSEARSSGIFSETNETQRLRQVAFPDFSFAKVNKASIQAVIPIHGLNVLLGANHERYTEGNLKISSGESYSLPAHLVNELVLTELLQADTNLLKDEYATIVKPIIDSKKGKNRQVYLTVLTETFYTRSIDLSFSTKTAFGAAGGVNPSTIGQGALISSNVVATANAVSVLNSNILSQTQVGGSLSVVHVTQNDILMRRNFIRPIAIGFRGYVIALSENPNGDVIISGVSSQTGTRGRATKLHKEPSNKSATSSMPNLTQ